MQTPALLPPLLLLLALTAVSAQDEVDEDSIGPQQEFDAWPVSDADIVIDGSGTMDGRTGEAKARCALRPFSLRAVLCTSHARLGEQKHFL